MPSNIWVEDDGTITKYTHDGSEGRCYEYINGDWVEPPAEPPAEPRSKPCT